jgi:hypothetical protein
VENISSNPAVGLRTDRMSSRPLGIHGVRLGLGSVIGSGWKPFLAGALAARAFSSVFFFFSSFLFRFES